MIRKVGLGAIAESRKKQEHFGKVSKMIESQEIEHMQRQMASLKQNLEKFAQQHKQEISSNPIFRQQFQQMCLSVGVDPLASKKGYWAELLGFGEFYFELAVQIVDVCVLTRTINGGLIRLEDLIGRLIKKRGIKDKNGITESDVRIAVDKLKCLGDGYTFMQAGNITYLVSVPFELNVDITQILEVAEKSAFFNNDNLLALKWAQERIDAVVNFLQQEGIIWLDIDPITGAASYYFYSLFFSIKPRESKTSKVQ